MKLFDFLLMDPLEDRQVADYREENLIVNTAYVNDGDHPIETAVSHPSYNEGKWVIVEAYDTEEEAKAGHDKWVKTMTESAPVELVDCCNAEVMQLKKEMGGQYVYPKQ